jgi:hypothetical protein
MPGEPHGSSTGTSAMGMLQLGVSDLFCLFLLSIQDQRNYPFQLRSLPDLLSSRLEIRSLGTWLGSTVQAKQNLETIQAYLYASQFCWELVHRRRT